MSRRFWVVLLVVLLVVVGLPALAVVGWLASKDSALARPVVPPSSVERPARAAAHTEEEVLDHPFWKHPPSRAELDAILERLLAPDGPAELAVGDNGKAWAPGSADGKGGGQHVLVHRPKDGGRQAVLTELYDRMARTTQEQYKAQFEKVNKK